MYPKLIADQLQSTERDSVRAIAYNQLSTNPVIRSLIDAVKRGAYVSVVINCYYDMLKNSWQSLSEINTLLAIANRNNIQMQEHSIFINDRFTYCNVDFRSVNRRFDRIGASREQIKEFVLSNQVLWYIFNQLHVGDIDLYNGRAKDIAYYGSSRGIVLDSFLGGVVENDAFSCIKGLGDKSAEIRTQLRDAEILDSFFALRHCAADEQVFIRLEGLCKNKLLMPVFNRLNSYQPKTSLDITDSILHQLSGSYKTGTPKFIVE